MLVVRQPRTPCGWNRAARDVRTKIREMIRQGKRPASTDFDDLWSAFKHLLVEAQHGRCGYCDRSVLGGGDGTVDHYRPKAEVRALLDDPTTWGRQKAHSAGVEGREAPILPDRGYHWLAYTWNNYIFACSSCNEKWKRSIFPVRRHPRCCPPRPKGYEEPLLLNCYRSLRPSDHLQFNEDGTVEARDGSPYGYETIRTVGLYRDPLCNERKEIAQRAHDLIRQLADGDEAEQDRALRDLYTMGGEQRRCFPGVVRAIVEKHFGMQWGELMATFNITPSGWM